MTNASTSSAPEEQTVTHFRNRGPHFELMHQTLGGIFDPAARKSQTPIERIAFDRGLQFGLCVDGA
jgi:hypothetical protein